MSADSDQQQAKLAKIEKLIADQEALRGLVDDAHIEATVADLQARRAFLLVELRDKNVATAIKTEVTAVGERAMTIKGNLSGNAFTGDIQGNVYIGQPTENLEKALSIYRRVLMQACGTLPLRGIDIGDSDPANNRDALSLTHVYIALDTTTHPEDRTYDRVERPLEKEGQSLSALEAATRHEKLVLLGDPGSGKSTFINHLAHCLAAHQLEPKAGWLSHLPQWPEADSDRLPLVITLRDFARSLPDPLPPQAEVKHLWDFMTDRLADQNLGFTVEAIQNRLEMGRVLLLLDGLDEVTNKIQQRFIRDAIIVFSERYPQNRCLVTCRVLSYQEADLQLPSEKFCAFELAPFDMEKIDNFIYAWYKELARLGTIPTLEEAARLTKQLKRTIRRPDLWPLAPNPLLLTVITLVNTHSRLPDTRALLYEEMVNILLWQWDKVSKQADVAPLHQLLRDADRNNIDLKRVLGKVAFNAHKQSGSDNYLADIGGLILHRAVAELHNGDLSWAEGMITVMKFRAGLLIERTSDVFTFPHRTFQEYLAGTHLAALPNFASAATNLAGVSPAWREVILLAAGYLVYVGRDWHKPLALVAELCPSQEVDTEIGWRNAWLAAEVLREIGLKRASDTNQGRDLLTRVQSRLARLLIRGRLTPRERLAAGNTLEKLHDPRPGVCTREPDIVNIPAGPFLMANEQREIYLEAFAIARYPVTNAQFHRFIEDGGYTETWRDCWTKEGWGYCKRNRWTTPRFWADEQFNQANQPVVGISWYEAVAYSRWLNRKTNKFYRLPTEAEWERAARHTDGRRYPWGDNQPGPETTNFSETSLERPCAVGSFPQDTTVCNVQDMGGNVNEWCQSRWRNEQKQGYTHYQPDDGIEDLNGDYKVPRVWKGGAYDDTETSLQCTFRHGDSPLIRVDYLGFRLACSRSGHNATKSKNA